MRIPPEVSIKASIRPGSVYYFPEESFQSSDPHYFIVVNLDPISDVAILLVCASSQLEKVRQRRVTCPGETLVHVNPSQYKGFTKPSVIDCNYVIEKSVDQLVDKLSQGRLQIKPEMDLSLVGTLRSLVVFSSIVSLPKWMPPARSVYPMP